jgi:para-nitrobenzyl esterase
VWRPEGAAADAPPAPVLFFIHGGGNAIGSTSEEAAPGVVTYDGAALATLTDAVVVTRRLSTRALRLAPTGSCRSPRTAGSRATTASWTRSPRSSGSHDNAAALEADAGRVMIFGESAGAVNVCMLLASPLAAGLFGAALMESGGCLATSRADAEAQAIAVATELGCPEGSDRACLEGITEEAWLAIIEPPLTGGRVGLAWGPTVDGHVLLDVPEAVITRGEHQHVPFIIGTNADEMAASVARTVTPDDVRRAFAVFGEYADELLALYPPGTTDADARAAYVGATTDGQFTCTARRIAAAAAASQDEPVFRYFFDHVPDTVAGRLLGAIHGLELLYVFSTYERTDYGPRANDDDRAVASLFGERWSALVGQGSPEGTPVWPSYDGTEPSLVIAGTPSVETEIRRAECEVWEAIRAAP